MDPAAPRLGRRANLKQFTLLAALNAFIGGILGIERTMLPVLAGRMPDRVVQTHIITVCAKGGGSSAQAAQVLRDPGFGHTWWLYGGALGWR
jgi:hypothetical protein